MTLRVKLNRRRFFASSLATGLLTSTAFAEEESALTTVAAIQMDCQVGNMDANLECAENWIRHATRKGARWIVLPEFFVSGMSYQPEKMLDAVQPIDGDATQLLKRLSKEQGAYIGGTFLTQSDADVLNTFVLTTPDGQVFTHDKDFPSGFAEHSFYAGGEDDEFVKRLKENGIDTQGPTIPSRRESIKSGVFPLSDSLSVGAAICWEQIRYRTARRLRNNVDLVLAASAWGILDPNVGVAEVDRNELIRWAADTKTMIHKTPGRLARLVGAPVVHANTVGSHWSRDGRSGKPAMLVRGMGDSQIVDANGSVLASRPHSDGEGVVVAKISIGRATPANTIPDREFWMPGFTETLQDSWHNGGAAGREYYLKTARPHRTRK